MASHRVPTAADTRFTMSALETAHGRVLSYRSTAARAMHLSGTFCSLSWTCPSNVFTPCLGTHLKMASWAHGLCRHVATIPLWCGLGRLWCGLGMSRQSLNSVAWAWRRVGFAGATAAPLAWHHITTKGYAHKTPTCLAPVVWFVAFPVEASDKVQERCSTASTVLTGDRRVKRPTQQALHRQGVCRASAAGPGALPVQKQSVPESGSHQSRSALPAHAAAGTCALLR